MLGVLRRPQTAADRAVPQWYIRQVPDAFSPFASALPGLTRLVAQFAGGVRVFLYVVPPSKNPPSRQSRFYQQRFYGVGTLAITARGAGGGGGGKPAGSLSRNLQPGCAGGLTLSVVPDGIAHVRWVFARQDRLGFVYRAPLTIDAAVKNNLAAARIPQRPPCPMPVMIRWYAADGHVVASKGSLKGVDTITRPVRHGKPWGP